MGDEQLLYDTGIPAPIGIGTARARLVLITVLLSGLAAAGACVGAILAPAPIYVAPLVAAMCVACPIFAVSEVPAALAALRAHRGEKALARLRRSLAQLPEIEHPLDR